jgi:hypothetical protein
MNLILVNYVFVLRLKEMFTIKIGTENSLLTNLTDADPYLTEACIISTDLDLCEVIILCAKAKSVSLHTVKAIGGEEV